MSSEYNRTCFVVMPFGTKPTGARQRRWGFLSRPVMADFDWIYDTVFVPAIEAASLPEGGRLTAHRADREFTSGIISKEMFEYIEYSRLVLCDITAANPNVMYELGHRHRARESGTVVVRQGSSAIPFDINQIRAFPYEYDPEEHIVASRKLITRVVNETLVQNTLTSPIQHALTVQRASGPELAFLLASAERAIAANDLAGATMAFRQAVRDVPDNALLRVRLGILLKEQGEMADARVQFEEAVRLEPTYSDAHRELGIAKHKMKELDAAEASLRRAVELSPHDFDAWSSLGGVLRRKERWDDARAAYERAVEISHGHSYPLLNVVVLEAKQSGTLFLSPTRQEQLRRAEHSLVGQADRTPPYNAPWSAFDLALIRFFHSDDAGFLRWTNAGADVSTAKYMPDTFAFTLKLLEAVAPGRPALGEAVRILRRAADALP